MARFVDSSSDKVIQAEWWDKDESVTIRRFGYGDRQFLAGETVRVGMQGTGAAAEMSGDVAVATMNLAILERGIRAWTLKDAGGQVPPLTRASIEALCEDDAEYILGEINAYNPRKRPLGGGQEAAPF